MLILQLYYKTIVSISTIRKKVMKQAIFFLISLFHFLSLTSIKFYLILIIVVIIVIILYLTLC